MRPMRGRRGQESIGSLCFNLKFQEIGGPSKRKRMACHAAPAGDTFDVCEPPKHTWEDKRGKWRIAAGEKGVRHLF